MSPALRSALILDDLILGIQNGKISRSEKERILWYLRNNNGRLDKNAVISTELRARVLAVCPMLREESDIVVTAESQNKSASTPATPSTEINSDAGYGFQPQS